MNEPRETFDTNYFAEVPPDVEDTFWKVRPTLAVNRDSRGVAELGFRDKIETDGDIYAPIPRAELQTFNELYSDRNLLKFLLVLHRLPVKFLASPFVDVGCGLGTAAIAWTALVKPSANQIASSICLDREPRQIEYAKNTLSSNLSLRDVLQFNSASFPDVDIPKTHVALFSFSLCEIIAEDYTLRQVVDALPRRFVIADYREVISAMFGEAGDRFYGTDIVQATYKLTGRLADLLGQDTIKVVGAYGRKWD